jgi:hypothetical protein
MIEWRWIIKDDKTRFSVIEAFLYSTVLFALLFCVAHQHLSNFSYTILGRKR